MQQFIDTRSRTVITNIKALLDDLRSRGYSDEAILQLVGLSASPIRIVMCRTGLSSPDDSSLKVKLNPVERTLYAFFTMHPEGIDARGLWNHYDELLSIYRSQNIEVEARHEDAVDALCEDSRAAFHTNISRIKRKIVDAMGENAGKYYTIYRHKDGLYRIDVINNSKNKTTCLVSRNTVP